jgi:glycosyltransferase involved in cell wall biosynthesis
MKSNSNHSLGVLLVGNFLSGSVGTRGACEELALHLAGLDGLRVLTTSAKPARIPRLADMLTTIWQRRHEFHVAQVDVYSGPAFLWAEASCTVLRRLGKPYVLTLHGGNLPGFARRRPDRVRRLLQSGTVVTTPSEYLRDQMSSYRSDLRLLPNALDLTAYRYRRRSRPEPNLVWLRAFHEIYNPMLGPRVLELLRRDFPDLRLTMVGPDKGDGSLQRTRDLAVTLGVRDRLDLPGGVPKNQTPGWLDKGDIFLNTPRVDNTPVSVLEAMACGLCIVSTKVGGIPYLLEDRTDALLVPDDDPAAMAAAVRQILTDRALADRLSTHARAKAEQHDWPVILPQWQALLTGVACLPGNEEKLAPCGVPGAVKQ